MIIDCHCHAGKGDGLTGPAGRPGKILYKNFLRLTKNIYSKNMNYVQTLQ
jgi:hypothetical protein